MKNRLFVWCILGMALLAITCTQPASSSKPEILAVEKLANYTVTFDKNHTDATDANPKTKTVTAPASTVGTLPAPPTLEGSVFIGWNKLQNGIGDYFTEETPITASVTVYAKWEQDGYLGVTLKVSGAEGSDSVSISPNGGRANDIITISYTLDNINNNNLLYFSGVTIPEIDQPGPGTTTYSIKNEDAVGKMITIHASFLHTNLTPDTIAFDSVNVSKTYGDASFNKTVSNNGIGGGTITYASNNENVATVNSSTGQVTILAAGASTITATKASDGTYEKAKASYTLTVAARQLTISNPTVTATKAYDGNTTAAVTAVGALTNKVGDDTVTVSIASATYNSANVTEANKITVVYSIAGTSAGNYTAPVNYTIGGTITPLQLTISGTMVTASKIYNGNADAAVTAVGTLANKVGSDNVTVSIASATYNSANVTEANKITVVYSIAGTSAGNYTAPMNYTIGGTIAKAPGGTIAAPTAAQTTLSSITVNALEASTGQTIEYAIATTQTAPGTDWQESTSFTGLTPSTNYYIFARTKPNNNYNEGTAVRSEAINTANRTQLAINNPTVTTTKAYDGNTTAAVTAVGALINLADGDTVTVTAAATYNSADAGTGKTITVVYTITGADADKYTAPTNYTTNGTITKAIGKTVTTVGSSFVAAAKNSTSITLTAVALSTAPSSGQAAEYAISTADTQPTSGWQESTAFTGLTPNTAYYFWARAKENNNYQAGTAIRTANSITTEKVQLTVSGTTITAKNYDGTAAAAIGNKGTLNGVISGDTVTLNATATYNSADAGTNKTVTVVYTIEGANANKYLAPINATLTNQTINKAAGSALTANPTAASITTNSITLNTITLSTATGQAIEYARNTTTATPTSGWQDSPTFSGLTANTNYYFFARSKANTNYNAGAVQTSAQIRTEAASGGGIGVPTTYKIDFEDASGPWTIGGISGNNGIGSVSIVADPGNSSQKSFSVASSNYNQAGHVKINLPYALKNYETVSFRHRMASGSVTGTVYMYIAGSSGSFIDNAFGNAAGNSGGYPQFAEFLLAEQSSLTTTNNSWTTYTITLPSEAAMGSSIRDLEGAIYLAIGINSNSNITQLFDDITFTLRPGKETILPPPPPPPAPLPTVGPTVPTTGAYASGSYRNMYKEMGKTDAEVTAKLNSLYTRFFEGSANQKIYYTDGSNSNGALAYIWDVGNDDARSEGMSYGMMMAVQMNKKAEFKALWNWAMTYMYNSDMTDKDKGGFFAWSVGTSTHSKKDAAPAPDGEFYFVTALLFAEARWGNEASGQGIYNYGYWARRIMHDMLHRPTAYGNQTGAPLFNEQYKLPIFSPIGNAATYTDASYHLPAFFDVWAMAANDSSIYYTSGNAAQVWDDKAQADAAATYFGECATASRNFLHNATHSVTGLNPERSPFQPTNGSSSESGDKSQFEYDAWRVAMNIAVDQHWWNKDRTWQTGFANRILNWFYSKGVTTYGDRWKVNGDPINPPTTDHSPGLVACNAVATLASTNVNAWEFLDDFWNVSMTEGQWRYYNGCLSMLAMLNLTGNFKIYYNGSGTPGVPNSFISPSSVEFSKQAPANIAITMELNGNTLSSIKNGNTTLTSGTNYSVSGSTVTLNTSYLNTLAVASHTLTFNFSQGSAQTLTVTVTNNIPNSTITPATANFNKNSASPNNKAIDVTVTLNGNTLSNIRNGGTTLTSGTQYTTSGSVITFPLAYLNTLAVGTTTLTFTFNQGNTQTLTITVTDSAPSAVVAGFRASGADALVSGAVAANIADMSAATVTFSAAGSASTATINDSGNLQITIGANNQNAVAIIPFQLGTDSLANYTKIRIEIAGVTGDIGYKKLTVEVPSSAGGTLANHGSNTEISSQSNAINSTTWYTHTVNLSGTLSAYSGAVNIGLWLENYNQATTYQIRAIYLVP